VHLPVLQNLPGVSVTAACDTEGEWLAAVRREYGVERLYVEAEWIVSNREVDAILVSTPAYAHEDLVILALDAGKHVLVERPLAIDPKSAEMLARVEAKSSLVTMVAYNDRFHPDVEKLREILHAGEIGRPLNVYCNMMSGSGQRLSVTGYHWDPSLGGGVLYEEAGDVVDLMRYLFEAEVEGGRAVARSEHHPHDFATVELELKNGIHVLATLSDRGIPDGTIEVVGESGKARINLAYPSGVELYPHEESRGWFGRRLKAVGKMGRAWRARKDFDGEQILESYRREWMHFLEGVRTGRKLRPSFADGLYTARAVDRLVRSVEERGTLVAAEPASEPSTAASEDKPLVTSGGPGIDMGWLASM